MPFALRDLPFFYVPVYIIYSINTCNVSGASLCYAHGHRSTLGKEVSGDALITTECYITSNINSVWIKQG